jgi:hypothetical protein
MTELEKKMEQWSERMAEKERAEQEQERQSAEKLRQEYLTRTGRTEIKP